MSDGRVHRYAKGRRPKFFDDSAVDEAMSMIMVLASEISVLRDRLDTFEKVAEQKGFASELDIESFEPDEATLAARETRRQDFFERLFFVARKKAAEMAAADNETRYQRVLDETAKGE